MPDRPLYCGDTQACITLHNLRWLAIGAQEGAPHTLPIRKACLLGHCIQGVTALLHHHAGSLHAETFDGLGG